MGKAQRDVIEPACLAGKKAELRSYLVLAKQAITPFMTLAAWRETAKAEAILARMNYGNEGYFFVYGLQETLLVHPRTPEGVGTIRLGHPNDKGFPHVQHLIARECKGGRFAKSASKPALKLTYVTPLPECRWLLCTAIT